ncbi:ATP-dependent DNA helicase, RecD/TraA family [Seinonella peptonophila]|uniref:ATP-dependent RecD2 DNA helicase n=1 Tax=Seinonella peptonophila TaxID=112248 RepID=A0A1M4WAA7_9BACL|nr:ATP-dependent RecD-like DNA helicase [Seinonella peptonophila]SHE78147.1 ATP-dependent DNA helicase, RecD/TraA family [Seinonella peptonophila]
MERSQLESNTGTFSITGSVVRQIYYNEENHYGVYLFRIHQAEGEWDKDHTMIVGYFLRLHEEENYRCYGTWRTHPKFGEQFQVERIEKELPKRREAVIKYLSGDLFPGVGQKTAKKIVDSIGEQTLERLAVKPELLEGVPGLTEGQIAIVRSGLEEHIALERTLVFLYEYGFGPIMALKIVQTYKQETIQIIEEDPYQLIGDIEGIGFHRADEIARKQGIAENSPRRYQAAVLYLLQESAMNAGHVFLTQEEIDQQLDGLLGENSLELFSSEVRSASIEELIIEQEVMIEENRIYLPSLYYAEFGLAKRVKELLEQETEQNFSTAEIYREIGDWEEESGISYADKQRDALQMALSSSLMILTGGPGTGKTTVIKGICQLYARLNECSLDPDDYGEDRSFPIRLAAPTGRAAKRMAEATGLPAMTIHRLLGYDGAGFEHHSQAPIAGELLIVDEVSMLDIWLANQLFRSIPDGMKVILVGDQNQLPSVGPGQVLQHLLEVEQIPRMELNEIYRQAEGSSIIQLAHAVKEGIVPDDLLTPLTDRRFFSCNSNQAVRVVVQTYHNAIQRGYTLQDVQVLAPVYKGPAGVNRLNQEIQAVVNPADEMKREIQFGETTFRLGDKVLQLVNHTDHPVYNGDMGLIISIQEDASADEPVCWVRYDQLEVPYRRTQLNQIQLAYACSVHKAQGSEFAIVILPVLHTYRHMLKRNLIYTGITRSTSYLILCGEQLAFAHGVKKGMSQQRNSQLTELILADW